MEMMFKISFKLIFFQYNFLTYEDGVQNSVLNYYYNHFYYLVHTLCNFKIFTSVDSTKFSLKSVFSHSLLSIYHLVNTFYQYNIFTYEDGVQNSLLN